MSDLHPDHEAVRSVINQSTELPNPEHHDLKKLPAPHIHWAKRIAIWLGGAIVLVVVIFAVGYLRFSWQKPVLLIPAKILPYPVAIAGNAWLSYNDYQKDIPNISSYLERNYPPDTFSGANLDRDMYTRKLILNKVIGESILAQLVETKKLEVTNDDIEETYNSYVQQSDEPDKVPETIKTLYGWTVDQFKQKLIRPQVMQDKLVESYLSEVRSKLDSIRNEVAGDVSKFSDIAKQKSEDVDTSGKGGAVTLNTAALTAAYGETNAGVIEKLEANQLSPIMETSNKYEFVLMEKKEAAAKKSDGTNYSLRRIALMVDANTWLSDQVNSTAKDMRVVLFEPRFRWETECGVMAKSEPSCTTATETAE